MEKIYVIDTNIVLDNVANIARLYDGGNNKVIIPETVVDEIDNKKTLFDEIGFQAREFARLVESMHVVKVGKNGNITETELENKDLKIIIASKDEYTSSVNDFSPNIINDRKIIEIASHYKNCVFITYDSMCKVRALSLNINVETLGTKENNEYCDSTYETNEQIDLNSQDLYNKHSIVSNVNGIQTLFNRCGNNFIEVDLNRLQKQDIKPANNRQKLFVDAILDDTKKIIVVQAQAGTGKTFLAVSSAIKLVKDKKYDKIIYIRNSIESVDRGEDIGYLSGNEEKLAIYNHPLFDTINFIAKNQLEKSNKNKSNKQMISTETISEKASEIIEKSNIETMWVGEMRGRTLSDAVVIADECLHEDQKIVTNKGVLSAKEIEERILCEEIKALSKNVQTNQMSYKPIISLKKEHIKSTKEKMYEVVMEDGSIMRLTGNHKLFSKNNGLIKVETIKSKLEAGEEVELLNTESENTKFLKFFQDVNEQNFKSKLNEIADKKIKFNIHTSFIIQHDDLLNLRKIIKEKYDNKYANFIRFINSGKMFCEKCGKLKDFDFVCNCEKYNCTHCDYVSKSKKLFNIHLKTSHNIKKCKICDNFYNISDGCSCKKYACDECNYRCSSLKTLREHYTRKHNIKPDLLPDKNCTECGTKLEKTSDLRSYRKCKNKNCNSYINFLNKKNLKIKTTKKNTPPIIKILQKCRYSRAAKKRELKFKETFINNKSLKSIYCEKGAHKNSQKMKQKIADGEFTPCVTNSWSKSRIIFNNTPYRSSFEVMFKLLDSDNILKYEKIRIPYIFENKKHNYIVDFYDPENKILYEIKPESEINNVVNKTKEKYAVKFCKENSMQYKIITEKFLKENISTITSKYKEVRHLFDVDSQRKIENIMKRLAK